MAEALQCSVVSRESYAKLRLQHGCPYIYVIRTEREELINEHDEAMYVQEGMIRLKAQYGFAHPFIKALCFYGAPQSMIDATLGLAGDAMHAAMVLGCGVKGCEAALPMQLLLQEGLIRLSRDENVHISDAAGKISLFEGTALDYLKTQQDDSVDVVTIDPIMSRPKRSAPGMRLLRPLAYQASLDAVWLYEALRVAKTHVVLKLGKGAPLPPQVRHHSVAVVRGAHVVYVVFPKKFGN